MARRPARRSAATTGAAHIASPRDAAIDAFMSLLAERQFQDIGLDDIAGRAGLSLSGLRAAFPGKAMILLAFIERIDLAVLAGGPAEGENERDRLFDVLMRRFDELLPYRAGLKSLMRSMRTSPSVACLTALSADRSMAWMLAAAGVGHSGIVGRFNRTGLAMVFTNTLGVWLEGAEPDNERTMAALDKALRRGERVIGFVRDACDMVTLVGGRRRSPGASTSA